MASERTPIYRHESFDELEQRSRSPSSRQSKFPLLDLPLELRQQIVSYLLPWSRDSGTPNRLFNTPRGSQRDGLFSLSNIVWQRGNTSLLSVCKQMHRECAELIYGTNTFLLRVTFRDVKFRFRWWLPSGMAPNKDIDILRAMPKKYLQFIKKVAVNIDNVDPYTGMLKFNVQGRGLAMGIQQKVRSLVDALSQYEMGGVGMPEELVVQGNRRLMKVNIRISNGNAVLDALRSDSERQRSGQHDASVSQDIQTMLEPFGDLRGVVQADVRGAVTNKTAEELAKRMRSEPSTEKVEDCNFEDKKMANLDLYHPPLCVYGNDMD